MLLVLIMAGIAVAVVVGGLTAFWVRLRRTRAELAATRAEVAVLRRHVLHQTEPEHEPPGRHLRIVPAVALVAADRRPKSLPARPPPRRPGRLRRRHR